MLDVIFAYLILAHSQPDQLHRLIERLLEQGGEDRVVLHLDSGSPLATRSREFPQRHGSRLQLVSSPVRVKWGHHSLVEATRRLLDTALAHPGPPFAIAHLLSGSDWPVASRARIVAGLGEPLSCHIESDATVQSDRMERWWVHDRWLGHSSTLSRPAAFARGAARRVGTLLDQVVARSQPYGAWHKGSQWWSLPHEACRVVAAELARPESRGRLRFTACADEHVIQTIVRSRFPDRVAPPHRFIDWSAASSSPRVLTQADEPAILASDAWFARKLDMTADPFFLALPAT